MPADDQPQAERLSISLPPHEKLDALTVRQLGVESLEGRVPERTQACAILPDRFDDLWMHPRFGPDEQATARVLDAAEIMEIDRATSRSQHTGSQ